MADTLVYLGAFNGERFIQEQVKSIEAQTRLCDLIISDDGSSDRTLEVIGNYRSTCSPVTISGPGQGFAQNFLSVFEHSRLNTYQWLAFADQDDVWDADHIERGIQALEAVRGPAVYGAKTRLVDVRGHYLGLSSNNGSQLGFGNALIQSFAGGNTLVLNREAIELLRDLASQLGGFRGWASHDWMIYQLITLAGGKVLFDTNPTISYRQHGNNHVGQNRSLRARASRAMRLWDGTFGRVLAAHAIELARPEIRGLMTARTGEIFERYLWARARRGLAGVKALRAAQVCRESEIETLAFECAFALSRC